MPAAEVAHGPQSPFRGVHFRLYDPAHLPVTLRSFREVLPRYKANTAAVEVNYHFRFRSHRETHEHTMLRESDARGLAQVAGEHGVRLISKDIFLCDWHYHLRDAYPSVEMFRDAGFDFVACGWRTREAILAFMKYAAQHGAGHFRGSLAINWGPFAPIARCLLEGVAEGADAEAIRQTAECFRLGMD